VEELIDQRPPPPLLKGPSHQRQSLISGQISDALGSHIRGDFCTQRKPTT